MSTGKGKQMQVVHGGSNQGKRHQVNTIQELERIIELGDQQIANYRLQYGAEASKVQILTEENTNLKKEIEELKQQLTDAKA